MQQHSQCYDAYTSLDNVKRCVREGHHVMILMRGVPGSGKSHLARQLQSLRNDGVLYSTDDYFMVNGVYTFNYGLLDENHKKNQIRARNAVQGSRTPVIIDNTNISGAHMKPYVLHAAKSFYEIYVVEPTTEWCRKAGQCAMRNTHGVTKEQIQKMLDDMDIQQNPSLQWLLGKDYSIELNPQLDEEDEPPEKSMTFAQPAPVAGTSSSFLSFGPPPVFAAMRPSPLPGVFLSMEHTPKPTEEELQMRTMATQTTEVTIALSLCGLPDMFDDVSQEGDYFAHTRPLDRGEQKERKSQCPEGRSEKGATSNLDLLVSIYPSEDMSTLHHNYRMYGLDKTIRMNLDMGIMPDYTTEVVKGAFDIDIATALETGSFESENRSEWYSDTNTSTTDSDDQTRLGLGQEIDVGRDLFKQLERLFGEAPKGGSTTTTTTLPITLLRQIYEAVLLQRTVEPHTEQDGAIALRMQLEERATENSSIDRPLTGAQNLQFRQICQDYPGFSDSALFDLFKSVGCNSTITRELLQGGGFKSESPEPQTKVIFPPRACAAVTSYQSERIPPSPAPTALGKSTVNGYISNAAFTSAHEKAKVLIDQSNMYRQKKEDLMKDARDHPSSTNTWNSHHSVHRREQTYKFAKREKELRAEAEQILYEANKRSRHLDLHFFTAATALEVVKERLEQLDRPDESRKGPSQQKLQIVTGYGKTTGGKGVVLNHIRTYLKNTKYDYSHINGGCIVVTCK